jgi:hypothetical protein
LDDGKYLNERTSKQNEELMKEINYPKEIQRSDFVKYACDEEKCEFEIKIYHQYHSLFCMVGFGVTIVVEGGINPCLAILNDIQCGRPVVFIQVLSVSCMNAIYCFHLFA